MKIYTAFPIETTSSRIVRFPCRRHNEIGPRYLVAVLLGSSLLKSTWGTNRAQGIHQANSCLAAC